MQVKKFAKWGLALTSTLVLGGVVGPVGGQLLNTTDVVYAQEVLYYKVHHITWDLDNTDTTVLEETLPIYPGETKTVSSHAKKIDGWHYDASEDFSKPLTYSDVLSGKQNSIAVVYSRPAGYKIVEKPAEQPTEKPAEKPVEQPVEIPAETPVEQPAEQPTEKPVATPAEQPISVAVIAISESDGPLSHYYVTINSGETKTVETPKVDGYKLDQYTSPTYELTYDNALKQLNSAGFAWVQFWMIKDAASESTVEQPAKQPVDTPAEKPVEQPVDTPVEQPTEQPAETPTDKPVDTPTEQPTETPTEKPAETPTDKPVEQLTDASSLTDQTAGKAQPVATTDKKKVDTSTPSTSPVASQDSAKPTAKSLPKTGDSGSMLLVLWGFLSGLSGLGLAARSRKKD